VNTRTIKSKPSRTGAGLSELDIARALLLHFVQAAGDEDDPPEYQVRWHVKAGRQFLANPLACVPLVGLFAKHRRMLKERDAVSRRTTTCEGRLVDVEHAVEAVFGKKKAPVPVVVAEPRAHS
jgi:hypothetical protein